MKKEVFSRIIHDVHASVAPEYGDIAYNGFVRPNTLEHWNYLRNVKNPISKLVRSYMPNRLFTLLDAGCGNGQLFHLYTELGAKVIVGIDFGETMLKEAQKRASLNQMRFIPVLGRLEDLAFIKDDVFQLVNFYGVIEHLPDPFVVLKELERVISPGGMIIFSVPRKASLAWLTYALFHPSLESMMPRRPLIQRLKHKMTLYRFFRNDEIDKMIGSLSEMDLLSRIPIAYGGMVGAIPSRPLRELAFRGRYKTLDMWNLFFKYLGVIPAGEYIAMRKKSRS